MAYTLMGIAGIGAVVAVIAGGAFLLITVGSLLWGKKLDPSAGILQSFLGIPLSSGTYTAQPEVLPISLGNSILIYQLPMPHNYTFVGKVGIRIYHRHL
jgi:hypothetical protein